MKITIFIVLFFIVLCSCSSGIDKDIPKEFEQEYLVIIEKRIGDSIVYDDLIEYFAKVSLKDSIYTWNKYYFNRVYEDLSLNGTAYVFDTVEIKVLLNNDFSIKEISNWNSLYTRVKKEVDKMIDSAPDSRKELIRIFANSFSLDSSAIVNKNTQDIQLINLGYQFLYDEESIDTNIFHIVKNETNDSIATLLFQSNIDEPNEINQIGEILAIKGNSELDDYKISYEIAKNVISKKVIYLHYNISFKEENIENIVSTTISRVN